MAHWQGLEPEGPFYNQWRGHREAQWQGLSPFTTNEMRGPREALVARSYSHVFFFWIFHYTYATFIMPFTVLLTTRRGPFWVPGRGHDPFTPPLATPLLVC